MKLFSVTCSVCTLAFGLVATAQGLPQKKVQSRITTPTEAPTPAPTAPAGGGLIFRTDEAKSSSQPDVKFKVPSNDEEKNRITADPVNEIYNDAPFRIAVGFPKWDFVLSYNPQNVAFSQRLDSGFNPSFSQTSTTAFSTMIRLNVDLSNFWEAEYSQFDVQANALSGATTSITSSTATPSALMIRGYWCSLGSLSSRRFCWGGELGSDATPSLQYTSPTTLEMTKVVDYVVGPGIIYQYPISERIGLHVKAAALLGMGVGQNSTMAVKTDTKLAAEAGLKGSFNDRHGWSLLGDYWVRTAKVEGLLGSTKVSWDAISSSLAVKLAYVLTF